MRLMVSKESHSGAMETDWDVEAPSLVTLADGLFI